MSEYSNRDVLVSTAWVAENTGKPDIRVVEVDVDTKAYDEGHVPGAIGWSWNTQLCDTVQRDIVPRQQFEKLMGGSGISNSTTVILYGDNNNWFAAWAFWQMKIYGHRDVRLMNGGRKKWLAEGRGVSREDLLGFRDVRNYDGSWTEWGNLVGVPVERGVAQTVAA